MLCWYFGLAAMRCYGCWLLNKFSCIKGIFSRMSKVFGLTLTLLISRILKVKKDLTISRICISRSPFISHKWFGHSLSPCPFSLDPPFWKWKWDLVLGHSYRIRFRMCLVCSGSYFLVYGMTQVILQGKNYFLTSGCKSFFASYQTKMSFGLKTSCAGISYEEL